MGILEAFGLGSLATLLCGGCIMRLRQWLQRRRLDWHGAGGYDAAETRFQAQIDGAFTQEVDEDDDELSAAELAQLQTLERELEAQARGGGAPLSALPPKSAAEARSSTEDDIGDEQRLMPVGASV